MNYLFAGLGNIGLEYANTRHNIGLLILDAYAKQAKVSFSNERLAYHTVISEEQHHVHLIKPTTYMNLSGRAVHHWMHEFKIPIENTLIIVDDLTLPFGTMRLKPKGSHAGHNGLKNIEMMLDTNQYPRLRFGIGDDFPKGHQVDYVLSDFNKYEQAELPVLMHHAIAIMQSFLSVGIELTMTRFN